MDLFFKTITWGGSLFVLLPLALVGALWFLGRGRFADAALLVCGLAGSSLLVHVLKLLFARPRPQAESLLVAMPPDFSFPSAHTGQAFAFFVACALVLSRHYGHTGAILLWAVCLLIAVLVGVSRVYLQVHFVSDVVFGALVGCCWVWFLYRILGVYLPRP